MSVRSRPSGSAAPLCLRTLCLIWALCAAVICPAAWQSLAATLRAADAPPVAGSGHAATVAPAGWMRESFSPDGRPAALNAGRIVPAAQEWRQEARLDPARDARHASDATPAGSALRFSAFAVLPEPELAPAAWACADSTPRLPATRGLFCRPPPSLKA